MPLYGVSMMSASQRGEKDSKWNPVAALPCNSWQDQVKSLEFHRLRYLELAELE